MRQSKNTMYYIVKYTEQSKYELHGVDNTTDGIYHEVKKKVFEIRGQFGRADYAFAWMDYYNGDITKEQRNKILGL